MRATAFFVGMLLTAVALPLEIAVLYAHVKQQRGRQLRVRASMLFLIFFTALRLVWFEEEYRKHNGWHLYFVNRLAQLFLFSGFGLYLESWVIVVRQSSGQPLVRGRDDDVVLDAATWLINVLVWAVVICLSVYFYVTRDTWLFNLGGVVLAVLTLALMLVVVCFGYSMQDAMSHVQLEAVQRLRQSIIHTAIVCTVCFSTRTVFWLWHPVAGHHAPGWAYPWLFYTCVEIPPVVALFTTLANPMRDRLSRRTSCVAVDKASWDFKSRIAEHIKAAFRVATNQARASEMVVQAPGRYDSADFTQIEVTEISSPMV